MMQKIGKGPLLIKKMSDMTRIETEKWDAYAERKPEDDLIVQNLQTSDFEISESALK